MVPASAGYKFCMSDSYRITLTNREGIGFESNGKATVLEAADAAGVLLPAGCRYGACLHCTARLEEGRVRMPQGTALTRQMMEERLFLPCVARVEGPCQIIVGGAKPLLSAHRLKPWSD